MPTQKRTRGRRIGGRVGLILVGILVALVLMEVGLRVAVCRVAGNLTPMFRRVQVSPLPEGSHPVLNHGLLLEKQFISTGAPPGSEFLVQHNVSRNGMLDDPVPNPRAAGELRVLVLGDSFVEARQVPMEANFCERLQMRLTRELERPVHVINGGVSSYSPILSYLQYSRYLRWVRPQVVLHVLFSNDAYDDLRYAQLATHDDEQRPLAVKPGVLFVQVDPDPVLAQQATDHRIAQAQLLHGIPVGLARFSYTASQLQYMIRGWRYKRMYPQRPPNEEFFILNGDPRLTRMQVMAKQLLVKHVGLLKDACENDGAQYMLSSAPLSAQIYGRSKKSYFSLGFEVTEADHALAVATAKELGVRYVDLRPPLRAGGKGLYYPRDGHWTPKGHAVVAEALYPAILEALQISLEDPEASR